MTKGLVSLAVFGLLGAARAHAAPPIRVTPDNFVRAETDLYFGNLLKEGATLGAFVHRRQVASIDEQTVIRLNRDTLYSSALFDLDAGPVTIHLPDAGTRFRSLMVVNQDHYVPAVRYKAGPHTFSRADVGTRYMVAAVRTLVNPGDPADVRQAHALQDGIQVMQKARGRFEAPSWDPESQATVRSALLALASTMGDFKRAFGRSGEVDPVRHLIGTAAGWGGNPDKDASYLNVVPARNDGTTVHRLRVGAVPVEGFWSVSVYNAEGYFEKNGFDAYSLNDLTARKEPDGTVAVQFGGCDGQVPNCLPIVKGWNYTVRLYRPRPEILAGRWTFPEPQPVP
jgi:hypothetical protein